ncbi:hypothetical protein Anas_09907 [Armadillidium nasatum]|uniref:Uncharacterized protein n=1 Tax=Armadillidium nasatum TaxID=96803 RepID=A0A5N5TEE6_9CRUS|nr:hypothetical protein Anas_09907 [Armadillidium nasatum]
MLPTSMSGYRILSF